MFYWVTVFDVRLGLFYLVISHYFYLIAIGSLMKQFVAYKGPTIGCGTFATVAISYYFLLLNISLCIAAVCRGLHMLLW